MIHEIGSKPIATEPTTIAGCFLDAVDRHANPRAQMYRVADGPSGSGRWESISAQDMLRRVAGLSKALAGLGIGAGDRVALFAPNCPEWHTADLAIQGLGAVTVPIYFNESPERMIYILKDSGARIVVTAGESQSRKVAESRAQLPGIERVISARQPADLNAGHVRYEDLIAADDDAVSEYRRRTEAVTSAQLATIIYTSGTTGEPKGVMLTHANLVSNATDSCRGFETLPSDIELSLLPLAHVYGRVVDYSYIFRGVTVAYVEQIETVPQALLEVHPTAMAAVPRLYEKMYANIIERGRRETGIKRRLFDWAIRTAEKAVPWRAYGRRPSAATIWQWQLANALVFTKIRSGVGGELRFLSSGSAPLGAGLIEFFWAIGLPVYQGYGLTETSPVVSTNTPDANKIGTVGRPIAGVEVRIAEDGEILVKGKCVMQGYYNKPDDTREAFTPDGWLRTGDIGALDAEGYLSITDRKKELLKTAGGKFVAPAPIENLLKSSPFIENSIVIGDRRKFVSVLIVPNFARIEAEAQKAGREILTPGQALSDSWVRDLIAHEIERLTGKLAHYEQPKRFALIEKDFTYATGELTYTMKLKRRVIEERYQDVIERMYADVQEPRPSQMA